MLLVAKTETRSNTMARKDLQRNSETAFCQILTLVAIQQGPSTAFQHQNLAPYIMSDVNVTLCILASIRQLSFIAALLKSQSFQLVKVVNSELFVLKYIILTQILDFYSEICCKKKCIFLCIKENCQSLYQALFLYSVERQMRLVTN